MRICAANPGIAQRYRGRVAVAWQRNRHGHMVAVLLPGNMPRAISGYVWVVFPACMAAAIGMRAHAHSHRGAFGFTARIIPMHPMQFLIMPLVRRACVVCARFACRWVWDIYRAFSDICVMVPAVKL